METNVTQQPKFVKKYRLLVDKYNGHEPAWKLSLFADEQDIKAQQLKILNWYNQACDIPQAKKWLYEYLKNQGEEKEVLDGFSCVPDLFFQTHRNAGWIARLNLLGSVDLPKNFCNRLSETVDAIREVAPQYAKKSVDRIRRMLAGKKSHTVIEIEKQKLNDAMATIDVGIDAFADAGYKGDTFSETWFSEQNINREQAERIVQFYTKQYKELKLAVDKKDEQLVEAYSFLTTKELKQLVLYIKSIVDAAHAWSINSKSSKVVSVKPKQPRKLRRRKVKSPAEQTKKLNYQAHAPEFLLSSISPLQIVGAEQLWVFNTKYRSLGVYYAADASGFTVKGSTICGFNESISIEKRLRKPGEPLKNVLDGGKVALRRILSDIKTKEKKLTGRINKDVILMRVL